MTICIAAMCEGGKKIVSVSDHMLSMGSFTADNLALKADVIHHNWFAMWSDEVSYVPAILECVERQLSREQEYGWMDVATAFVNARNAVLSSEINSHILAKHGYDLRTFYARGKGELTPSEFNALHREIKAFNLSVDFLVYGFDSHHNGHIFTFDKEGRTKSCDKSGFWAIGGGDVNALSSIFFAAKRNGYNQNSTLGACLYVTLAAKFMAESAEAVGEKTFLSVQQFNHLSGYIKQGVLPEYRKRWFEMWAPKVPTVEIEFLLNHFEHGSEQTPPAASGVSVGKSGG